MDGYVCWDADIQEASPERPVLLRVSCEVHMGDAPGAGPARGEAWLITTGGPMPLRGDRVLPVEAVRRSGDQVRVEKRGEGKTNIAEPGEDIREGAPLVSAGEVIRPECAGALAACGLPHVRAYRRPRVALLATGTELVEVSEDATAIPPGRIFNSNSVALGGILRTLGCTVEYQGIVPDHPEELRERFAAACDGYDVVISTGGVSVGRYDAVHRTWLDLGARLVVGRIDLKPGGPFFAGRLGRTWAIGLSGTPVACLAAFHLLVQPVLRRLQGRRHTVRPVHVGLLTSPFPRHSGTMRALWARVNEESPGLPHVEVLTGRPTGTLASLLPANGLVLLPAGTSSLPAGSRVATLRLDHDEDRDRLMIPHPRPGPLVVGVTGESGSGKTTVITALIRRLTQMGIRAAAVKHAPHGFAGDWPGSDSARMEEAGAIAVVLVGPEETVVRIPAPIDDAARAARLVVDVGERVWGSAPDVILVEGFAHADRPVIQVGRQKRGTAAGEVWATVSSVTDLGPDALEDEVRRIADMVRARLTAVRAEAPHRR